MIWTPNDDGGSHLANVLLLESGKSKKTPRASCYLILILSRPESVGRTAGHERFSGGPPGRIIIGAPLRGKPP